jgi:hypothetical protein
VIETPKSPDAQTRCATATLAEHRSVDIGICRGRDNPGVTCLTRETFRDIIGASHRASE